MGRRGKATPVEVRKRMVYQRMELGWDIDVIAQGNDVATRTVRNILRRFEDTATILSVAEFDPFFDGRGENSIFTSYVTFIIFYFNYYFSYLLY